MDEAAFTKRVGLKSLNHHSQEVGMGVGGYRDVRNTQAKSRGAPLNITQAKMTYMRDTSTRLEFKSFITEESFSSEWDWLGSCAQEPTTEQITQ